MNYNNNNIDILIGADYYFDILTGEMVRGESGPVAVNSDFGWVVTGPTSDTESLGSSFAHRGAMFIINTILICVERG